MKHTIKLLSIQALKDKEHNRQFSAMIDNTKIVGMVHLIIGQVMQYRFIFDDGLIDTKHKDYKNMRRELLRQMLLKNAHMSQKGLR